MQALKEGIFNMNIPARDRAHAYLSAAAERNPGDWEKHSLVAAHCAEKIASKCGMDAEQAYVLGLLHDIGRRAGVTGMRHIYDGYCFLNGEGFPSVGRICITHSFPLKGLEYYIGKNDCTEQETAFIMRFLEQTEYDDFDRLIQLCDAMAYPDGVCTIEKRLIDVSIRHGISKDPVPKWKKYFELKSYFDAKCGTNIYNYFSIVL